MLALKNCRNMLGILCLFCSYFSACKVGLINWLPCLVVWHAHSGPGFWTGNEIIFLIDSIYVIKSKIRLFWSVIIRFCIKSCWMEITVLSLKRWLSDEIDSFVTGAKQSISYVSANKELRVTACDKLNCWWQSVRPIAKVTRGLYNLSTFLVLTWTIFSFNFYVRTWQKKKKKGSSGLSSRPLIPCVGSQLSSVQLELGVRWASKLFWVQHTSKEINYVNSLVL
jgi:hypothetical protein